MKLWPRKCSSGLRITLYRDNAGEWRWTMAARNDRIVADSAEGYQRKRDAMAMAERIAAGGHTIDEGEAP